MTSNNIEEKIEQERQIARQACDISGANSKECAAAWDAVEELQAEASHQKQKMSHKSSFENYCDNNPDAAECRVYDS